MIIGFIGLGEVGSTFSIGLAKNGIKVKGYDIKLSNFLEKNSFQPCLEAGVELVKSPAKLIEGSDIVIAATSCAQAISTAEISKPYLKKEQIYVELNSAVPEVKKTIYHILSPVCNFVDGSILDFPSQYGVMAPIGISGPMAYKVMETLNSFGMNIIYVGDEIGQASALKVIRSIFTKGLESILIECMHAAQTCGIADEVFNSIISYLSDKPVEKTLKIAIKTNPKHTRRRALEVDGINIMLEKMDVNNIMSIATAKKLHWLEEVDVKGRLVGRNPETALEVIDEIIKYNTKK